MTEANGSGADSRRRGVGFPQMGLQEAVDAIVLAGQNGPNHSHDAFATYLGHSTANSGAFRAKLASLRDWGLIERGDKDRVTLSSLAQEFVLAVPDHYRARKLLRATFESCRVFGVLYNDSAKNAPLDVTRIRNNALMRHGVAADQADRFVDSFIKSVVFAGLGEFDGSRLILRPQAEVADHDDELPEGLSSQNSNTTVPGSSSAAKNAISPPAEPSSSSSAPVALRQAWDIDGGEIEFAIRTPKPLPLEIYSLMADMAKTASAMAKLLPLPADPAGGGSGEAGA